MQGLTGASFEDMGKSMGKRLADGIKSTLKDWFNIDVGGIKESIGGAKSAVEEVSAATALTGSATALTGSAGSLEGSAAALMEAAAALSGKGSGGGGGGGDEYEWSMPGFGGGNLDDILQDIPHEALPGPDMLIENATLIDEVMQDIDSSLTEGIMDLGQSGSKGFSSILSSLGESFMNGLGSLGSSLSSMVSSLLSGIGNMFGGGGGGSWLSSLFSFFGGGSFGLGGGAVGGSVHFSGSDLLIPAKKGGIFPNISDMMALPTGRFAEGGIVDRPMIGLIGEQPGRREAVIPLPDNRRVPVQLLGGGDNGKSSPPIVHVEFLGDIVDPAAQGMTPDEVVKVWIENYSSGGETRSAMRRDPALSTR
jgi:hypothetical protein